MEVVMIKSIHFNYHFVSAGRRDPVFRSIMPVVVCSMLKRGLYNHAARPARVYIYHRSGLPYMATVKLVMVESMGGLHGSGQP